MAAGRFEQGYPFGRLFRAKGPDGTWEGEAAMQELRLRQHAHLARAFLREMEINRGYWLRVLLWIVRRRLLRRDTLMRLPNGVLMELRRSSMSAFEVFSTCGHVDWGSEELLRRFLGSDEVFLDIGANIGYYSLMMADRAMYIFAFEPDYRVLPDLARNVANYPRIEIVSKAVAGYSGRRRFVNDAYSSCMSHLTADDDDASTTTDVDTITLNDFMDTKLQMRVGAIKIDVEGFEVEVLRGGRGIIDQHQPLVLTEFTVASGRPNSRSDLIEFVANIGYVMYAYVFSYNHKWGRRLQLCRLGNLDHKDFPEAIWDSWDVDRAEGSTARRTLAKMLFLVPPRLAADFERLSAHSRSE